MALLHRARGTSLASLLFCSTSLGTAAVREATSHSTSSRVYHYCANSLSRMPAVKQESLVLLTGASGFLAAHVGQQFLNKGYRVRGTVRSQAKGDYLRKLYEKDGTADKFDFVIVEDVEQDGAFDEAVKGVDAIAHTASPFHFNVTDPQKDLIQPAVQGTTNLLRAALLEPKVQRVVITSSFAAVTNPHDPVYTFTEKDWNEFSPKELEKKGKDCDPFHSYRASKTLAERAAWDFLKENTKDGKAPFDIATINPPFVFGPVIHEIPSAKSLNTSVAAFYSYLLGDKSAEDATNPGGSAVDVRDVALAHVLALEKEDASNERFLISAKDFTFQELLDALEADPEMVDLIRNDFPKATKSGKKDLKGLKQNLIDTTKMEKVLGLKARSLEETVKDMTKSLAERQKEW